jgi:colanic acid/amylovoran biosynthesis glycosyltransferase
MGSLAFLCPNATRTHSQPGLAELIRRPELWPGIGRKGRAFVEAEFDLNKRNDALVEVYCNIAAQKSEASFAPAKRWTTSMQSTR